MITMLLTLVSEGGEGGAPSPFAVNSGLVIWTWVVFVVLLFLLKKFAFPAILKATEERERTIARQLDEAAKANTEAKALLDENRRLLAESRTQAQAMMAEAKSAAEKERATAIDKTRHEQEELLERARRDIAAERDKALTDLRREAVDLSLAAAGRLIGQKLDGASDRSLVEGYLASLEKAT
ncbi:MAG: F0F1 ATP synthase subunit B [Gemmatimonadetes bacterium]|nr:F0F1 ATP synthase subunit B [Gemmatimonadota bacterium]MBK7351009.1 F0F1 ATP synthase subunit B [Gemmatimonadota bacterium]MBK7714984.1 F0F1 ATP synthase subunit B [Gemmatimonadota bacterium]MBK7786169.1 F0F1 ATP synthase subunit B [Gemmatimonadota bacterium]MBK7922536.1 F0F1 ATP synthase subunit B [Gemmatimonadota bacterium]